MAEHIREIKGNDLLLEGSKIFNDKMGIEYISILVTFLLSYTSITLYTHGGVVFFQENVACHQYLWLDSTHDRYWEISSKNVISNNNTDHM